MFGKSKEAPSTPGGKEPNSKFATLGTAALTFVVLVGGMSTAARHVDKIAGSPVPAAAEPAAPHHSDIVPIAPDTSTYVIPSSEVPVTTPSEVTPSVPAATTSNEAPATSADIAVPAPSEAAPALPTVEVPTLSVTEYEGQPQELIRAFVEKDLQAWANADANTNTVQLINSRLAQGEDLENICASIAKTNADTIAPAIFGANYADIPSIIQSVDTFRELNKTTLEKYFKTANETTPYLTIITGISPKVLDESAHRHLVQGSVAISIADNGPDTSLGADSTANPVQTYNVLFEDPQNTGNYTVTGLSR